MIIFFDWDNKGSSGPQDGLSDHVGIVQKVENGIVYTVEGNSGDSCRVNQYSIGPVSYTHLPKTLPDTEVPETDYVLLSDEDFDENQSSK